MGTTVMISELVAPFVYRYKLILRSYAAPSKAFLEEQAERQRAERERAEQERAERELAKKHKHQSYEDFSPISTSELDFPFVVLLTRSFTQATPSKCQIEELREKGCPEDMLSNIRQGMMMMITSSIEAFL